MKKLIVYILALAATSCTTVYMPNGESYRTANSPWSIVNNTGVQLDVFSGGHALVKNLETGQVMPIALVLFQEETVLTVVGHTPDGKYVGTESQRFYYHTPYTWAVTRLQKPEQP
jgi:hypothetical protein